MSLPLNFCVSTMSATGPQSTQSAVAGERLIPLEESKVSRCIKQSKRITFLARDGGDGAYLALTLSQTQLEFRATGSRAGSLSLYGGRCCGKRCGASIRT